jgi:DNA-binding GntR family transcriptional regulator
MDITEKIRLPVLRQSIGTPLWLQLKHALRDLVTFHLKAGDRIPSEIELCEHYSMSRVTVRQAITSLVDEGLLHKQQGRGTFVLAPRLAEHPVDTGHFLTTGLDAAPPEHVSLFSAELMVSPDWLSSKLGLATGAEVFKIRKILSPEPAPSAFRTTFVPVDLARDLLDQDLSGPIQLVLERRYGLEAASADEVIEFIIADEFRAGMLKVPVEHPIILQERITYLGSGQAISCARTYYRAERFRFEHRLRRNPATDTGL